MKKLLLIIAMTIVAFVCAACEDYDDITYYNAIGEGYVFAYDSVGVLQPIQDAKIIVDTKLESGSGLFGSNIPESAIYTTDATGKYRIRFIKRTYKDNAKSYGICIESLYIVRFIIDVKEVQSAKKILALDTIKFER